MKGFNQAAVVGSLLLSLAGCAQIGLNVLIAGKPEVEDYKVAMGESKDGPALMARFTLIQDLDVDSQGNVYVVDDSSNQVEPGDKLTTSNLIRKISPEGQVTTFAGRSKEQGTKPIYSLPLAGNDTEIEVVDNFLYFDNLGCLLRYDLNQTSSKPEFTEVMGKCASSETLERLAREPDFKPGYDLGIGLRLKDTIGNLYFSAWIPAENRSKDYVLNSKGELKELPKFHGAPYRAADSKGFFYFVNPPSSGEAVGSLRKYDVEGNTVDEPRAIFLNPFPSFTPLTIDLRDNLYLITREEGPFGSFSWFLKRLSPDGRLEKLSSLTDQQGRRIGPRYLAVNPEATMLYLADSTAVYKLPLNPTGGRKQ